MTVKKKNVTCKNFILLALIALVVRLILSAFYRGFDTDVNCFIGWSNIVFEGGIGNFYLSDTFHDYPPGYMYVLWVIGALRSLLNITSYDSFIAVALVKLPAMLCDIIMGYLVYKISSEKLSEYKSLLCSMLFLFNPAILINSSMWGQVDSVLGVFVLLTIYFVYKKKMPLAYISFCAGFLIKPQMGFIGPVLLLAIIEHVFMNKFTWKKFWYNLSTGIGSIVLLILAALPFGLEQVIAQYADTMASYTYASVNAYNFWTMLGKNWIQQSEKFIGLSMQTWGTVFIVFVYAFILAFWLLSWKKKKNDRTKYFFMGAFAIIGIFTMSVRMHERYMFPAIALLLAYYAVKPRKQSLWLYLIMSAVHFVNVVHVLVWYDPKNFDWNDSVSAIVGGIMVIAFAYMIYLSFTFLKDESKEYVPLETTGIIKVKTEKKDVNTKGMFVSKPMAKICKVDILIMLIITFIYSCIALYNLGDMEAPQSGWTASAENEQYVFEFDEPVSIQKIWYYLGNYHNPHFDFEILNENGEWIKVIEDFEMSSVFNWSEKEFSDTSATTSVRMTSLSSQASIWELTFVDTDGNYVTPSNAEVCPELFDEKELIPERESYLNGTYFDEIYHARTAYEFTEGLYSYEWTHPPLGKVFIMFGILIFGMVPFGWRIAGTVFGIIMLPCLYVFAKKLFKKTWVATVAMLLFAFDFMHFAQTRIATIDVFVTLFIILMYYFMYLYINRSYYDRKFSKVMIPLGLSGLFMGFGVASKWTGCYAGVGLAIIFFADLYKRYKEYKYALSRSGEKTNGISHKTVIKEFPKRTKQTILLCCVFFIVIPAIIYVLSYIPFVSSSGNNLIERVLQNQKNMYNYHADLVSEHPFSSHWYQWPFMTRPIWYYSHKVDDVISEGISSFGNPFVWWAGIPAFLYMIYAAVKDSDKKAMFLGLGYLAQYLPWFFVTRTTYIYHYFPSVPFVVLMVTYALYKFARNSKKRRYWVYGYVALVIIAFIMFYPVLSGYPVDRNYVITWLKWFESWVLIG